MTLGQVLSLLPGLLNADDGEAPSMKLGCVAPRFLLLVFLSPGGELAVVARLPTVSMARRHLELSSSSLADE